MKAKGGSSGGGGDVPRYAPTNETDYPPVVEEGGTVYYRFYCRPLFIVYEKYKNGVKLGYYVLPGEKSIFNFQTMLNYVENISRGETLCQLVLSKPSRSESNRLSHLSQKADRRD